jgi:CdiI N-terminal domain
MFEIILTDERVPETDSGVVALYGKICVGDYAETFITSLVSWNPNAYERHWVSALRRLLEGASKSALITSYVEPELADHLVWWPLYREGDTVYVQNHMLFYDQLEKPFSPRDPWQTVPQRRTVNGEGQRISEWVTDLSSVQKCLARVEHH